jgi:hypothetical protein
MTENKKSAREALDRLADAFVEDILNMSDEEILAEFEEDHGDPDQHEKELREFFEESVMIANKQRLADAKAGVAARRKMTSSPSAPDDIDEVRKRLRLIFKAPNETQQITLAARNQKESDMSDTDARTLLEDLEELEEATPDDTNNEKP